MNRTRCRGAFVLPAAVILALSGNAAAQYMYIDTDGNGVHDAGDVIAETGSTTVDVWLKTDFNRDGSAAGCTLPNGSQKTIFSYTFALHSVGGTVSWSAFTNQMAGFTIGAGEIAESTYYYNGRGSPDSIRAAGTYHLATLVATPTAGTPYLTIVPYLESNADAITSFGSECLGADFDNTQKLGKDWYDADGAGPADSWIAGGVALTTGAGGRDFPAAIADGTGGAIVVWEDGRAGGADKNIFAQRIDASGNPYWASGGVAICVDPGIQERPRIVTDGNGGAIIAWHDLRNQYPDGDIYAQRISANGTVMWAANGIPVCTAPYDQYFGQSTRSMVQDGAGGVILVWTDARAGGPFHGDIYAQNVDASGATRWASNGVPVCVFLTPEQFQYEAVAASDGSGGAYFAWEDYRNDSTCICVGSKDIYAQRLASSGSPVWPTDGIPICIAAGDQSQIDITDDGSGGAVLTWGDARVSAMQRGIYAQRVTSSGTVLWSNDGVLVSTLLGAQDAPSIASDGHGGAFVALSPTGSSRVQHLDNTGGLNWGTDGVLLVSGTSSYGPRLAPDGANGVVVAWNQSSSDAGAMFGQRLALTTGEGTWPATGVNFGTSLGIPGRKGIVPDERGGFIAAWVAPVSGQSEILAARVAPGGGTYTTGVSVGASEPTGVGLGAVYPNPFNPSVTIPLTLDRDGFARLEIYDTMGRRVRTLLSRQVTAGSQRVLWDGRGDAGEWVSSGVYFCRLDALGARFTRRLVLVR